MPPEQKQQVDPDINEQNVAIGFEKVLFTVPALKIAEEMLG